MPSANNSDNAEQPLLLPSQSNREEENIGCCHTKHPFNRFIALILMCLMGFGSYFCYDNPGALQDKLRDDLKLSTTQFVWFYSVYSWPNIILCFIGGFLIDRVFGIRLGTIIYMIIVLIGVLLFALGGFVNAYWLMIMGRFVFGIGGESLAVAQNSYAVRWFKGKELNMVFGLQLSFARVGSTVNFLIMEPIYNWVSPYYSGFERIGVVLFIASLTCVFSLICVLVLAWMDKRADRHMNVQSGDHNQEEVVKLSDIRYFKGTFWFVSVICVAYYVAIFPFLALGKVFFERKYDMTPSEANNINSILYILSAIASPTLGLLIDKTGRNIYWMIISIVTTICAHSILTFTFWNPYIGMVIFGLSYSALASSLWPLVALIVNDNQLGTAYGICQAVQNLGLAVVSLITGVIVDKGGYFMLELFFLGCLFVAFIAALLIYIYDAANNDILNMSPKQRMDHKSEIRDEDIFDSTTEGLDRIDQSSVSDSDRIRSRYLTRIVSRSDVDGAH